MRLRFTIRDLLWLVIACSLGVSWWVDHKRVDKDRIRAREFYLELGQSLENKKKQLAEIPGRLMTAERELRHSQWRVKVLEAQLEERRNGSGD